MQTLAQSGFLKALGWSLINSLWQMALLWLVYFIITFNSKKFSAAVRHSLAAILLCAGVVWFIFSFGYYYVNSESGNNIFPAFFLTQNSLLAGLNNLIILVNQLLPYCACVYLFFLVFHFVKYSRYFFHSQKLVNEGLYRMDPQLRMFVDEISHRLGIKKKVEVFLSEIADSPMTIGFLRYIILIPLATINNLSTQQVEAILLHELAHIKRNDYLLNLIITVVEMLFFFNPFCRLFINVIRKERENSCDDLVLQFKYDPHVYVTALLCLERSRHTYHPMAMAATGKNNKLLLLRVKRITGQKISQPRIKSKFVFFFLFSIIAGCMLQLQFKMLPAVFHVTVSKTNNKKNSGGNEIQNIVYTSSPVIEKSRPHKTSTSKKEENESINEDVSNSEDQNLVAVNSGQTEDQANNENVIAANQYETIDYSIQTPKVAVSPAENLGLSDYYPYVPRSSFTYEIVPDSSSPQTTILSQEELDANQTLEKSLKALEAIDWKKIEKEMSGEKNVAVNIRKLKTELRRSLITLNWKKINKDAEASAGVDADASRINNDIQMQLEALENLKTKDQLQAKKLEGEIFQNKIKLQQNYLQKQRQALKKITVSKGKKVVYI
jgi:beta-lactamase regulating signal transducer with metallopeptidase domain